MKQRAAVSASLSTLANPQRDLKRNALYLQSRMTPLSISPSTPATSQISARTRSWTSECKHSEYTQNVNKDDV
jgi:hypothetical protein